ncbi:MAG TPA: peptidoglycan DD-metalloendopeptidase family protein [Herbaspirillum sp.]|jgi:murein DD-endopeptidase MepM/ murein hydrolase activator NlpD
MTPLRPIALLILLSILNACSTAPNASGDLTSNGYYKVAQGDTLYGIARKFHQTVPGLMRLNGLKDGDDISVDQLLRINSVRAVTSAPVRRSSGRKAAAVKEAEPAAADNTPAPRDWVWPADGEASAAFGVRKGIEIAGKMGQDVRAANAGSVSFVGGGIRGYGNLVIIKHSGNVLSVYAHNKVVVVKEGQAVAKGQKIAEMGNSDSNTVKLYFEIRRNGKPVDPAPYLPKR